MSAPSMRLSILPLRWADIRDVPIEKKALYLSLCFLVSELNALQRMALLSFQILSDQPAFEAAARIQSNSLIRVISGKCHEVGKFLKNCVEKAHDKDVRDICRNFLGRFDTLDAAKGSHISEHIRRKIAFHLDFREAVKSTKHADDSVDCSWYIHDAEGNCYFPAGEHAIFESNLLRASKDAKHGIRTDTDHSEWVKWTVSVLALVKEMHVEVFERFIFQPLGGKLQPSNSIDIPKELVAQRGVDFLPLFLGGVE